MRQKVSAGAENPVAVPALKFTHLADNTCAQQNSFSVKKSSALITPQNMILLMYSETGGSWKHLIAQVARKVQPLLIRLQMSRKEKS
ncbi:hypothetical protein BaRGS_00010882 [Batillaria attramentaria]|uniref:Uncharacterized protein n=1 Tax=Batillaria attramentaria TaxID=370345 RepID=A0ABD0LF59_9CAEN